MTKGQRKGSASACTNASEATNESLNGDMRTAIIALIEKNDPIIATVVEAISQAILARLVVNKNFAKQIVDSILKTDVIADIKQDIYKASQMDTTRAAADAAEMAARVSQLETINTKLYNDLDVMEQYSRRNCLIVHGVPDTTDPESAVLDIFTNKLGVSIGRETIDRCHRLGTSANSSTSRPRAVIVKFTTYQARQKVFSMKRQLKGTKLLITENLTRRRNELLSKAKSLPNVTATWTSDGRIVCLLASGRKVSITTDQDLRHLDRQ